MKRFLLVFGILLCMQCCAFSINLYDLGDGLYVDLDSISREENYGYALIEYHSGDRPFHLLVLNEVDLLNYKGRTIKAAEVDCDGKIINIREGLEVPQSAREWHDISEGSIFWIIYEMLKNLEPSDDIK